MISPHSPRHALLLGCTILTVASTPAFSQSAAPVAAATTAAAGATGVSGVLLGGLALAGLAAAAAGGGGGGGSGGSDDSPSQSRWSGGAGPVFRFGLDEEVPTGTSADFETGEYQRNYSLSLIGASHRYADGGTGRGTLGAIFDTGADVTHRELTFGINRERSYSYHTGTGDVRDFDGHGTAVAGIVAGERDGFGMHGVAFEASLMILQGLARPDGDPSTHLTMPVTSAWADAQRRAYSAGATAINHSWTLIDPQTDGSYLVTDFSDRTDLGGFLGHDVVSALSESRTNDLLTVFATGNDAATQPSAVAGIPIHFGEFAAHWVAVTAVDADKRLASYANACGMAQAFCLAAPGSGLLMPDSVHAAGSSDRYQIGSGTSYAAPHVTGAALLLKSQFPELTAPEITTILFDTAEDLGAPGIDEVYGRGLLDLENAVRPQGTLSLQMARTIGDAETADESFVAAAGGFGTAVTAALSGRHVMVTDGYDRGYGADMGDFVASGDPLSGASARIQRFALDRSSAASLQSAGQSLHLARGDDHLALSAEGAGWADAEAFAAPYSAFLDDATFLRHEAALGGGATLHVTGASDTGGAGGAYMAGGLGLDFGGGSLTFELGQLSESGSVLGTSFGGGFGSDTEAETRFARVGGSVGFAPGLALHASASWGITDFGQDGIVSGGRDIESTAVGFGISAEGLLGGTLTAGVSRPLSIAGGKLDLDVPVALTAAADGVRTNGVIRETNTIDLAEGEAPLDLQIGHSIDFGPARLAAGGLYRAAGPGEGDVAATVGLSISF
ncbi:S8 family peptidase [Roseitranquillus sediminis]|uniref:S8 family peptidase n=1 Tax=Roseitranquillus sediminis TaxID=2809051 RepID=UPI001D0C2794|nr:S8 family peptidase [Roseitranquillus sediminis]MBM9593013.1 S8 family serine peptidase [Roseitranquillus sediminis]